MSKEEKNKNSLPCKSLDRVVARLNGLGVDSVCATGPALSAPGCSIGLKLNPPGC